MKKALLTLFVFASIFSYGQRSGTFDTIKVRGGGSFRGVVDMDTNRIIKLDTATGQYDAVPLFQIMDSIDAGTGAVTYWTRVGGKLYQTTLTDEVGIKSITPDADLDVNGRFAVNNHSPIFNAIYEPFETLSDSIVTASYDAFGLITQLSDGKLAVFYRQGSFHVAAGDYGIIKMRTSTDQGKTWGDSTTILSEANIDLRNVSGGVTPNGRIVLFITRYNPDLSTYLSIGYIYSDDSGLTWSAFTTINRYTCTTLSDTHGGLIQIGGDSLMMSWYGNDGTNYQEHVIFSTDQGKTWGNDVTVVNSTTVDWDEPSYAYLGGSVIVGMCRVYEDIFPQLDTNFRQVMSFDNGTTWQDQGFITFDTISESAPVWLTVWNDLDGKRTVGCFYYERTVGKVRVILARAEDLINNGISAWNVNTRTDIASGNYKNSHSGYPSVTHPKGSNHSIVSWYDSGRTSVKANLKFNVYPQNNNGSYFIGNSLFSPYTIRLGGSTLTDVFIGQTGGANIHINGLYDSSGDLGISGQVLSSTVTGTNWISGSGIDHGALSGLADDDHAQYALLSGRTSGQTLTGGTTTTADLTFKTTSGVGTTGADMHFLVGNNGATEAITVLNSGRIGFGAPLPDEKVEVAGATVGGFIKTTIRNTDVTNSSSGAGIEFIPTTGQWGGAIFTDRGRGVTNNLGALYFSAGSAGDAYDAGNIRMILDNRGYLGIATTAPDKPLEVNSATGLGIRTTYNDANGSAANYVDYSVGSTGDATITPSGGDLTLAGNLILGAKNITSSNVINADSVHANWFGGSDTKIGEAGSKLSIGMDSALLVSSPGVQNGSTALVNGDAIYDFAVLNAAPLYDSIAVHLDTLQVLRTDINSIASSSPLIFTQTANKSITNTITKTTLIGTGVGSVTIAANTLAAGSVIRCTVRGLHTNDTGAPHDLTIGVTLNDTVYASRTGQIVTATDNWNWDISFDIVVRTSGATGTAIIAGSGLYEKRSSVYYEVIPLTSSTQQTINTTAAQTLNITAMWDAASIALDITSVSLVIELLQ